MSQKHADHPHSSGRRFVGGRIRIAAFGALLTAALLPATLPAQDTLTLDAALRMAHDANYSLRRAGNDLAIARNNNTAGAAGMLPSVDLTAGYVGALNNVNQHLTTGDVVQRTNAAANTYTSGLGITWTVFDGFRTTTQRHRLDELEQLSSESYRSTDEDLTSQVIKSYYDIVQQQKVLGVTKQAVSLSEQRLENVQLKYQVGENSKRELLQARVDLNADRSTEIRQESTLDNSKTSFNLLLARNAATPFAVIDTIAVATDLDYQALLRESLDNNSTVRAARISSSLAELDLRTAESARYPKVGVNFGYNFLQADGQTGSVINNRTNGWGYGLTASLNLFNGFNTNRDIENSQIEIASSELILKQATDQVASDLLRAYQNYTNRLQVVALEEENVGIAKENFELAMDRYRVGTLIPVELREAQNAYVAAESRLVAARYDAKQAETDLLLLSGRLAPKAP